MNKPFGGTSCRVHGIPSHFRSLSYLAIRPVLVFLLLAGMAGTQLCAAAPFDVPPDGKPEKLTGDLRYTPPTALAFDARNRPYMFNADAPEQFGSILTLRNGSWRRLSFADDLREAFPRVQLPPEPDKHAPGTLTVDDGGHLYAIVYVRPETGVEHRPVLLHSPEANGEFDVLEIPGNPGTAFLEVRTGNHVLNRPPAIGTLSFRTSYPTRWTSYHTLAVILPEKQNGELELGSPITVSKRCFGVSNHSGGYSFAVTTGEKTHLTYAEIPQERGGGNPTFTATVNRRNGNVRSKTFLTEAPPEKADVHSTPVIAADEDGYLHVIAGAHGQSFRHLRSKTPDRITDGWTKPVKIGGKQTYATLVCDGRNRMHTVYRRWTPLPRLTHQFLPDRDHSWSKERVLVNPPPGHEGYGIFYHRLFVDRRGNLYLSFTFWETETKDSGEYPRVLVTSGDGGNTWKRATTSGFSRRISKAGKQAR